MRQLTDHITNLANDKIQINVVDEPGSGGANHVYAIIPPPNAKNEVLVTTIVFQNGPIAEVGVNGLTHEVLLAIVIDRLRCFQTGPFKCYENQMAMQYAESALASLKQRTLARMERGVEGTHTA